MGKIIELDDFRPIWLNAYTQCLDCHYRAICTYPVTMQWPSECGKCGQMTMEVVEVIE